LRPAESLTSLSLPGGWRVDQRITPSKNATGGFFSVGYRVIHTDGRVAFLKAMDISAALGGKNKAQDLLVLTKIYNFERDLALKCSAHRMTKVVLPIDHGEIVPPGMHPSDFVFYIIFELANGDIRSEMAKVQTFDLAWCLRSLHNSAIGMMQLHSKGITHQDLKPSNILTFGDGQFKIADLGRASEVGGNSPYDDHKIAGDLSYAPLELTFDLNCEDFERRRRADIYLLGSLIFFHFSGLSANQSLRFKLREHGHNLSANFYENMPYLEHAFSESLEALRIDVCKTAGKLSDEIIQIARELCDPNPDARGHKRFDTSLTSRYDLQRYVSKLDRLATKAAIGQI
jgi:serine/threonine protein kinase